MTSLSLSRRAETSSLSLVMDVLKSLRLRRLRALQRKHLLSLDDNLLRDMGLDRLNVMRGKF